MDAPGVLLVDLEDLPDLAVLPVGGVGPRVFEGETVLCDPLTGLLLAGHEFLRTDDEDDMCGTPHVGGQLAAGGSNEWKTYSRRKQPFRPTSVTPNVRYVRVLILPTWPPGTYWVDNVRLVEREEGGN